MKLLSAVAAGLIVVAALYFRAVDRRLDKKILFEQPPRDDYDLDTLYRRYYSDSQIDVVSVKEIWMEVASTLSLPEGKLRPSDRFGVDVGGGIFVTPELDTLQQLALARIRQARTDGFSEKAELATLSAIKMVDQYVLTLAKQR